MVYRDEVRKEIIDGREIDIIPRSFIDHGRVAMNIAMLFDHHLGEERLALYRIDLIAGERDILIPDVAVCSPDLIRYDGIHGTPELVAEVLTPGSILYDRGYKMELYRCLGVGEYWLVDFLNKSKTVEQYLLEEGRYRLNGVYIKHPDSILERMSSEVQAALPTRFRCSLCDDLEISVEDIFKEMLFE